MPQKDILIMDTTNNYGYGNDYNNNNIDNNGYNGYDNGYGYGDSTNAEPRRFAPRPRIDYLARAEAATAPKKEYKDMEPGFYTGSLIKVENKTSKKGNSMLVLTFRAVVDGGESMTAKAWVCTDSKFKWAQDRFCCKWLGLRLADLAIAPLPMPCRFAVANQNDFTSVTAIIPTEDSPAIATPPTQPAPPEVSYAPAIPATTDDGYAGLEDAVCLTASDGNVAPF